MAYPMNPPDPTNVVGRRIVAFLIDFTVIAAIWFAVGAFAFLSWSETDTTGSVSCGQESSTSFDQSTDDQPSFCLELDDEVRYIPDGSENGFTVLVYGTALAAGALNNVVLQGATGASLGKLAVSLRVIRQDGRKANMGWNLLRWLLLLAGTLVCCIGWIVDLVMVFTTKGHRRVGDYAAGTFVVGKDAVGTPPVIPGATAPATPTGAPGYYTPQGPPPSGYGAQPGWAPPAEIPPTVPPTVDAPPPTGPTDPTTTAAPGTDGPTWDQARDAYIQYDHELGEWMQWDDQGNRWRPIDQ